MTAQDQRLLVQLDPPATSSALLADYQWTNEQIKLLTDIRFRLLAFVPPAVTITVALLQTPLLGSAQIHPLIMAGVGVLGFRVTLGIILYDLRNSQLYNALVHRAMLIERELKIRRLAGVLAAASMSRDPGENLYGGIHAHRPMSFGRFLGFSISHNSALSIVYGTVLAVWIYPIVKGFALVFGLFVKGELQGIPWGHPSLWCEACKDIFAPNSGNVVVAVSLLVTVIAALLFTRVLALLDLPGVARRAIYNNASNRQVSWTAFYRGVDKLATDENKGLFGRISRWLRLWRIGVYKVESKRTVEYKTVEYRRVRKPRNKKANTTEKIRSI